VKKRVFMTKRILRITDLSQRFIAIPFHMSPDRSLEVLGDSFVVGNRGFSGTT